MSGSSMQYQITDHVTIIVLIQELSVSWITTLVRRHGDVKQRFLAAAG
jgi:hypothetical protein